MKITPKQYAVGLYESTKGVDRLKSEQRVGNFVNILRRNNDLSLITEIIEQYYKHYRKEKNISKIEIASNDKLSSETLNKIIQKFSKQIEIEEKIDKSLVGGVVLKIDDNILIDGSVKRKLEDLRNSIK